MRPLLSTRLFAETCCAPDALRLARNAGFPSLELAAGSIGTDLFAPGEPGRLARALAAEGMRAPWLRIDPSVTRRLADPAAMLRFGETLGRLRFEGVIVTGPVAGPDLGELVSQVGLAGARLVLERELFTGAELRRWPDTVDFGWDLFAASRAGAGPRDFQRFLDGVPSGRLRAVRVSGDDGSGRRVVPGEREALLLEEAWRRYQPEYVIYDVQDPSGFGAATSLDHVLAELRSFHAGEKLPHATTYPGGLFGSGLAPG